MTLVNQSQTRHTIDNQTFTQQPRLMADEVTDNIGNAAASRQSADNLCRLFPISRRNATDRNEVPHNIFGLPSKWAFQLFVPAIRSYGLLRHIGFQYRPVTAKGSPDRNALGSLHSWTA